ncbi:MAG TPA: tetratricopeptide repeat protein [Pyrinomonadaceae bacterium]|nr:tetratricopeptide repeat protein [Pyrinomonadaceae bacterium]
MEPLAVEFTASLSENAKKPLFGNDVTMTVFLAGGTKDLGAIAPTEPRQQLPSVRGPVLDTSKSHSVVDHRSTVVVNLPQNIFGSPGTYQLQFVLYTADKKITSNVITFAVAAPRGVDLKAYRFLKKVNGDTSFEWVWKNKDGVAALNQFADEYQGSVYADRALLHLGEVFMAKGNLQSAEQQFEKLKDNSDPHLAASAATYLKEIAEKRADNEKNQPNN